MSETEKILDDIRSQLEVQGRSGNWDYNPYMRGVYNGLECALATAEHRDPIYKDIPENGYRGES